jgi:hypothetical protein
MAEPEASAIEAMAIEIVDLPNLPIYSVVIVHRFL